MSTHNLCFEQKYEKYRRSLSENFQSFGSKINKVTGPVVYIMYLIELWTQVKSDLHNENTPIQNTLYFFLFKNNENFQMILFYFFLISSQIIDCWYTFEPPQ